MKAVPVANLEALILRLHAKSVASREEAIRIRQTIYVATDAESNCQIRAEVWDSVIDELSALAAAAVDVPVEAQGKPDAPKAGKDK